MSSKKANIKPRAVKGDFSCNILRIEKQLKKKEKSSLLNLLGLELRILMLRGTCLSNQATKTFTGVLALLLEYIV